MVTLNRPERFNAMSIDLVIELHDVLEEVSADNDCYVVVLTGAGRAFCSGLDLKDYRIIPNIDGLEVGRIAQRSMRYYSRLIPLFRRMHQPVICAVNGPSYGGGMCLTLAAELRIASQSATFNSTGIVNGLTSTELGVSWLLPRLIGAAHSNDILWVNLENPSLESAIEIEDRNQLMLGFTENLPEAIRAFDQKRRPVYTDAPRRDLFDRPSDQAADPQLSDGSARSARRSRKSGSTEGS